MGYNFSGLLLRVSSIMNSDPPPLRPVRIMFHRHIYELVLSSLSIYFYRRLELLLLDSLYTCYTLRIPFFYKWSSSSWFALFGHKQYYKNNLCYVSNPTFYISRFDLVRHLLSAGCRDLIKDLQGCVSSGFNF